jgi:anti-sigma regulatory factor (Ser/Thr protein kinase)
MSKADRRVTVPRNGQAPSVDPFVHEALLYRSPEEYLAGTLPFVEAGLARAEPVLVATPPANLELLRRALGPATADRVELVDMCEAGRNPGRILPAVLLGFAGAHPRRRVRAIGEPIWHGRSHLEYPACVQHEALINVAFAGHDAAILCAYDASALDQPTIDDAERTHPRLATAAGARTSRRFTDPVALVADFNLPLPPPPPHAVTLPVEVAGAGWLGGSHALANLRRFVAEQAHAAGLAPMRVADVTVAVNELATNTIGHAAGPGTLATWLEDGQLVYQLTDSGHIADPLAGRLPPAAEALSGRGLFVVNNVCDLVRIHTEPGRTTIRVQMATGEPQLVGGAE